MRILDYLQSNNEDNVVLGLRLLGVNEDLIERYKTKFINYSILSDYFKYKQIYIDECSHSLMFFLNLINQVSEYETVCKIDDYNYLIIFIKLKEIQ